VLAAFNERLCIKDCSMSYCIADWTAACRADVERLQGSICVRDTGDSLGSVPAHQVL